MRLATRLTSPARALLAAGLLLATACSAPAPATPVATSAPATAAPAAKPTTAAPPTTASAGAPAAPSNPSPAASGDKKKIVMSYTTTSPTEIWRATAQTKGFFDKAGLDIEATQISNLDAAVASVVAGGTQVAAVGGPPALTAAAAGADILVVAVVTPVWDFQLYVPDSIKTPADLKGKKIGVPTPGSPAEIAARLVLPKYGLNPDTDVTMINVGAPQNRVPALKAGAVDASPITPPDDLELKALGGFHLLIDIAADKIPGDVQGLVTTRTWANAHRDELQKLVDCMVQAEAVLHHDKEFALDLMKKNIKYDDPAAYEDAWQYFYGSEIVTPILPYPRLNQFADTQKQLGKTNDKVAAFDASTLIDESFVKSAADRGLDK